MFPPLAEGAAFEGVEQELRVDTRLYADGQALGDDLVERETGQVVHQLGDRPASYWPEVKDGRAHGI